MYYVKCWHDARRSMLAYLGVVAFCVVVSVLPRPGRVILAGSKEEADLVVSWTYVCAWILAMAFGAIGPGADIGEGFGSFLLTRPRTRAYFIWVAWLAGLSELIVMLALTVGMLTIASVIRSGVAWYHVPWGFHTDRARMIGVLVTTTLVTYGITHLLTAVFRSGKRGIIGAIAVMAAYAFGNDWLYTWSGVRLPDPSATTWPLIVAWLLFALACPLAAQAVLARAEV